MHRDAPPTFNGWVTQHLFSLKTNLSSFLLKAGFFFGHPGGIWSLENSFSWVFPLSICGTCWPWPSGVARHLRWLDWNIWSTYQRTRSEGDGHMVIQHRLCGFNTLALAMKRQCQTGCTCRNSCSSERYFFACSNTSVYRCTGTVYTLTYLHILTWLHPTHTHSRALSMYML